MMRSVELADVVSQMDEWPKSWAIGDEDVEIGVEICAVMLPFVESLLDSGLSEKTIKRHIRNLWTLGGELIADVNVECGRGNVAAKTLLMEAIEDEGGPLLRGVTENMQRSFDGTCSKLYRYLKGKSGVRGEGQQDREPKL